jgi:hypothetical protein
LGGNGWERGEGGRNDPNIVCTYEYNKKKKKEKIYIYKRVSSLQGEPGIRRRHQGILST